ncbi:MAG: hypothetical protein Q9168_007188 [Polycauliona sp. 1 TL-2023]
MLSEEISKPTIPSEETNISTMPLEETSESTMASEETNRPSTSHTSCSSCCSNVSYTSSVEWNHDTWSVYVHRVHQLCRQLWPSASEDEEFIVEKLQGGSYNRIIGIDTPPSTGAAHGSYILRIPRFEFAQQAREMAIIRYVRQHSSIPTAEIIFSDATSENPLEEPYVVHSRIPGRTLQAAYPTLNHDQKRAIARQWGQLLLSQRAVQNSTHGIINGTTNEDGTTVYAIQPYDVNGEPEIDPPDACLFPAQSVLDMFVMQFERCEASRIRHTVDAELEPKLDFCDRQCAFAKDMDAAGFFKDTFYTLCHLDLYPRNVMVHVQSDGAANISGVLDWDSAVFAPDFAVCAPPSWIWAWKDDEEDADDDEAEIIPSNPEDQQLKQDFEEVVGKELHELFYAPQYRLGRRLFDLAITGMTSNESYDSYLKLMKDWDEFQSKATGLTPSVDDDLIDLEVPSIEADDAEAELNSEVPDPSPEVRLDLIGLHIAPEEEDDDVESVE